MDEATAFAFRKAATAIAQGRRRLERAHEDIGGALKIFFGLSEEDCGGHRPEPHLVVSLDEVLGHLEASVRALRGLGSQG